jgi:RecA-family ATPase
MSLQLTLCKRVVDSGDIESVLNFGLTLDDFTELQAKSFWSMLLLYYEQERSRGAVISTQMLQSLFPTLRMEDDQPGMTVQALCSEIRRARVVTDSNALAVKCMAEIAVPMTDPSNAIAELVGQLQSLLSLSAGASTVPTPATAGPFFWNRMSTVTADWVEEQPPPAKYLLWDNRSNAPALDAEGVALLVAAGGIGKSFGALALVLAVASGTAWLGALHGPKGRVLIVAAEESAERVRRRLYHTARALGLDWERLTESVDVLDIHDTPIGLVDGKNTPTDWSRELAALVRKTGPYALVLMDPIGRIAGCNIDADNAAAAALIGTLEGISNDAKGLVLAIHHSDKNARRQGIVDATAVRGVTGLGDFARAVLVLSSKAEGELEVISLVMPKANNVKRWDPILLRRDEHGVLLPLSEVDASKLAHAKAEADPAQRKQTKLDAEDAAVTKAVRERPGIPLRDLVKRVQALVGCGASRAEVAISRAVGERLRVIAGPRSAKLHYMKAEAPGREGGPRTAAEQTGAGEAPLGADVTS